MKTHEEREGTDRYTFDFGRCSASRGWAQIDTSEDAWYLGSWTNPAELKIVSYAEGDVLVQEAESTEEYVKEIRLISEEENFTGIDPLCIPAIEAEFTKLGLDDLLH